VSNSVLHKRMFGVLLSNSALHTFMFGVLLSNSALHKRMFGVFLSNSTLHTCMFEQKKLGLKYKYFCKKKKIFLLFSKKVLFLRFQIFSQ